MPQRIHIYATEDDLAAIEKIQAIKPHWKNVNMIYREGLYLLLKSLQRSPAPSPQSAYQPTSQPRYIRED